MSLLFVIISVPHKNCANCVSFEHRLLGSISMRSPFFFPVPFSIRVTTDNQGGWCCGYSFVRWNGTRKGVAG